MGVVHPKVPHPVGGIWTPICYTVFVSASLHPSLHLNPSFEFDLISVVHPKVPHSVGGGSGPPSTIWLFVSTSLHHSLHRNQFSQFCTFVTNKLTQTHKDRTVNIKT